MDDFKLLREYVDGRSDDAFRTLVDRHVNLVYSAALRQVRNPHLAEEVAQAVFIILARKAGSIRADAVLSAWLLRTTRYTAANALRSTIRRQNYEREAMDTMLQESDSGQAWPQIESMLDEALVTLGEKDRAAVALRFFEQKSFREIGTAFGTTDDNAQKRVSRALEKLRNFFKQRGCAVSAATLAGALTANSVKAAPEGISAVIAKAVIGNTAAMSVTSYVSATLLALRWLRIKALLSYSLIPIVVAAFVWTAMHGKAGTGSVNPMSGHTTNFASGPAATINTAKATPTDNAPRFRFRVIDSVKREPVADVRLTLTERVTTREWTTNIVYTDRDGVGYLPRPSHPLLHWDYRIEVYRDGYVPKYVSWGGLQGDLFAEFPETHETKIDPGTLIGGTVINERNEPVAGATLSFNVSGPAPATTKERERLTMMGGYHHETTDKHGRWHCDHVPNDFSMITWQLTHPHHQWCVYGIEDAANPGYQQMTTVTANALVEQKAIMKMKTGVLVQGVVTDEHDLPVAGADIFRPDQYGLPELKTKTDAAGNFAFDDAPRADLSMLVQATGFSPTNVTVSTPKGGANVRIVLSTGHLLRCRVVDPTSDAIPAARIQLVDVRRYAWRAVSDAQGNLEWPSAPAEELAYEIEADGYIAKTVKFTADGADHTVVLNKINSNDQRPSVRVVANVVDAASKKAVDAFNILLTESRASGEGTFTEVKAAGTGKDGKANFLVSSSAFPFIVEVQAEGYMPVRFTNRTQATTNLSLQIELTNTTAISGVVRMPSGEPVAGAMAVLCTERDKPHMEQPGKLFIRHYERTASVQTGADGRFSFQPKLDARAVVVAHELGYAEVSPDLTVSEVITLQPWGRIEGTLKLGTEAVSNQSIRVYSQFYDVEAVHVYIRTVTDSQGNFVFEKVPPGELQVCYEPNYDVRKIGIVPQSHGASITVHAGQTSKIVVGGSGRTVIGRVDTAGISEPIDWLRDVHKLSLRVAEPELNYPKREDYKSSAEFANAIAEFHQKIKPFWQSEEGKNIIRSRREYVLLFKQDGSFRVGAVPPGNYILSITPTKRPQANNQLALAWPQIGEMKMNVTIPEGDEETPVDLGTLTLNKKQ